MLLAVDTSTARIGLALYDGQQVIAELVWIGRQRHTIELAPAVADLLARTGTDIADLRVLGVAIGPGSFTSLRVGLALVKGLALARHLPLVGVPSLDILAAAQALDDRPLAAVLQAGRGRLAVAWYTVRDGRWSVQGPAVVKTAPALADSIRRPSLVCGELDAGQRQRLERKRKNVRLISPALGLRRPGVLAELAWQRWQAGQTDDPASLAPIYLHTAGPVPA